MQLTRDAMAVAIDSPFVSSLHLLPRVYTLCRQCQWKTWQQICRSQGQPCRRGGKDEGHKGATLQSGSS